MAKEEKIRYAYRTCPCFAWDIESVQTWLEDMAAQGLVLEADGIFLGIFTFQRQQPQRQRYRLTPVKQKRGFFDDSDAPEAEEQEFSARCGWEYVLRYGSFYIYRATDPNVRPLHTDPTVQAMALKSLNRQRWNLIVSELLFWGIYFSLRGSSALSFFRAGAVIGPLFQTAAICLILWVAVSLLAVPVRLSRYRKRLLAGDSLENRKPWKPGALRVRCLKLLPAVLGMVLLFSWLNSLHLAYNRAPLEELPKPFAAMEDVFPGQELDRSSSMGDYNTGVAYSNLLSRNVEWNESCYAQYEGQQVHCILRLTYHETAGQVLAKGVAEDIYREARARYNGKRFEVLQAPETELDSVQVFSSYGILHVLIRHENTVVDAVVSITGGDQGNLWHLWLEAMEQKLLG